MQVQQKRFTFVHKTFQRVRSCNKTSCYKFKSGVGLQNLTFKRHYQQQSSRGRRRVNWDMGETRISFQSKGAGLFHSSQQLLIQH